MAHGNVMVEHSNCIIHLDCLIEFECSLGTVSTALYNHHSHHCNRRQMCSPSESSISSGDSVPSRWSVSEDSLSVGSPPPMFIGNPQTITSLEMASSEYVIDRHHHPPGPHNDDNMVVLALWTLKYKRKHSIEESRAEEEEKENKNNSSNNNINTKYKLIIEPAVIDQANWNVSITSDKDIPREFPHEVVSLHCSQVMLFKETSSSMPSFAASLPRTHRDFVLPSWQVKTLQMVGFDVQGELNHGTYGKVYRARRRDQQQQQQQPTTSGGQLVAIKVMDMSRFSHNYKCNFLARELKVLCSLPKHVNVVETYDIFQTTAADITEAGHEVAQGCLINVVMKYCSGKDMYDFLVCQKYVPEKFAARWFKQLLAAVGHLHRNRIAHRDIKIENLLLDDHYNLKLADFGYCCKVESVETTTECCDQRQLPTTTSSEATSLGHQEKRSNTPCGSYVYSSPELLRGQPYLPTKNDVWGCGIVFYLILFGDYPEIKIDLAQVNQSGGYHYHAPASPVVSSGAMALLNTIFVIEDKRPSVAQLEAYDWIKNIPTEVSTQELHQLVASNRPAAAPFPRVETMMFVPQTLSEDEDDEAKLLDI